MDDLFIKFLAVENDFAQKPRLSEKPLHGRFQVFQKDDVVHYLDTACGGAGTGSYKADGIAVHLSRLRP